ncbi:MAG: endo-1,4-beta-xylanase, partial [Elusimicrobia bacterium]|nr:endo-1,4-beta-xylanase [Elusimicrobiota bacterium]
MRRFGLPALAVLAALFAYRTRSPRAPAPPPPAPPRPPGVLELVRPADLLDPASFLAGGYGAARAVSAGGGVPFERAVRLETRSRPPNPYDAQLRVPTRAAIRAGDALLARFYLRAGSPAARVDFVFERSRGDFRKTVVVPLDAGPRWRRVEVPFRADADYPAGGAQATFRVGFEPQAIELGGFELRRGPAPGVPQAIGRYEGRERGAAWRKAAEARIERVRKAELVVRAVGPDGRPLKGARVRARLARHAFAFGAAVDPRHLTGAGADAERYRATFLRLFNSATIENDLKWPFWEGDGRERADRAVAWLAERGVRLRGHALVWPGLEHVPEAARALASEPERLRAAVREHVSAEAAAYRGRMAQWDVLNEPLHQADLLRVLGAGEAAEWFRLARAADPDARLFVNEYGLLDGYGEDRETRRDFAALARRLLEDGAPLDGLGLQCHFQSHLTPPARLVGALDELAALGKPIEATELDVDVPDEVLKADYLRDFMIALFSHPA